MNKGISVALIPTISGREYVLVAEQVKPFQAALKDYEIHICMDDIEKLNDTNLLIAGLLKKMQNKLTPDDRLYQMLKTYRSRCRTVQQLYRKYIKGEVEAKRVTHAAYLVLRGIPFYPEMDYGGLLMKTKHRGVRSAV